MGKNVIQFSEFDGFIFTNEYYNYRDNEKYQLIS